MLRVVIARQRLLLTILISIVIAAGCGEKVDDATFEKAQAEKLARKHSNATIFDGEKHFTNIRQLTFGGQNAEAYFSNDGSRLIFQSTRNDLSCDAIFTINADGSQPKMVSSGKGTTSCGFLAPDDSYMIYASTHLVQTDCPPKPDMSRGYVWAVYPSFDIFKADSDGSNLVRLTETDGYDAECVISPQGDKILFTSTRTGDLELFMMDIDGQNVEQLTHQFVKTVVRTISITRLEKNFNCIAHHAGVVIKFQRFSKEVVERGQFVRDIQRKAVPVAFGLIA